MPYFSIANWMHPKTELFSLQINIVEPIGDIYYPLLIESICLNLIYILNWNWNAFNKQLVSSTGWAF